MNRGYKVGNDVKIDGKKMKRVSGEKLKGI